MGCTACIINYLNLLDDPDNYGKFELRQHDLSQYMRLDAAAMKALNMLPNAQDGMSFFRSFHADFDPS